MFDELWSDPTILSLVLFAVNDGVNSETGVRPLDAMFGCAAATPPTQSGSEKVRGKVLNLLPG